MFQLIIFLALLAVLGVAGQVSTTIHASRYGRTPVHEGFFWVSTSVGCIGAVFLIGTGVYLAAVGAP